MTNSTEVPSYVQTSIDRKCKEADEAWRHQTVQEIERIYLVHAENELRMMRRYADGHRDSHPAWYTVGYRAVTEAWRTQLLFAKFKAAVHHPNFSHCTASHPVSDRHLSVYHRCEGGSGVQKAASVPKDTPGVHTLAVVLNLNPVQGGKRGAYAS